MKILHKNALLKVLKGRLGVKAVGGTLIKGIKGKTFKYPFKEYVLLFYFIMYNKYFMFYDIYNYDGLFNCWIYR